MNIKKQESARKEILAVINNKLTLLPVLWEEFHSPAGDFGEENHFFVCGKSKKKTAPKTYIHYESALFPEAWYL
jgi:hypothetical protein